MRNDLWDLINAQVNIPVLEKLYPPQRTISGQSVEPVVELDGRKMLQFASLDYLSLATDSRVIDAGVEALRLHGVGSLASPLVAGTIDAHLELRDALAEYMNAESAVVFTSGMLANLGSITAVIDSQFRFLFGRPSRAKRAIFTDELNHASISMACGIAEAGGVEVYTYHHASTDHLAHLLEKHRVDLNLIVTDAVFSMDGDIAPLEKIVEVAGAFQTENAKIVVYADDAHGVGVLGENGRGACEVCGVEDSVIRMGVISKSFGTLGGYVVGDMWFVDYLRHCTTQMFSMGVPAAETAATVVALNIARREPWRRETVLSHAKYLRDNLRAEGFEVVGDWHIVPIILGDEDRASGVAAALEDVGVLAPEIKYPAVPKGRARLRLSPVYKNTKEELDFFLDHFQTAVRQVDRGVYAA